MDQEKLLRQAGDLAEDLVSREVDINELKKLVSYFIDCRDKEGLLALLDARWQEAERYKRQIESGTKRWQAFGLFIRSGTTYDHIEGLHDLIPSAISDLTPEEVGYLLGWTARLATAYEEVPNLLAESVDRRRGTVKWFNKGKGYGFIQPDGGGKDFFVHISQTPDQQGLREKQRVSFVVGKGPKGRSQAQDVLAE
jgi:CspA family cold shock protein